MAEYLREAFDLKSIPEPLLKLLGVFLKLEVRGKAGRGKKTLEKMLDMIESKEEYNYYYQLRNAITEKLDELEHGGELKSRTSSTTSSSLSHSTNFTRSQTRNKTSKPSFNECVEKHSYRRTSIPSKTQYKHSIQFVTDFGDVDYDELYRQILYCCIHSIDDDVSEKKRLDLAKSIFQCDDEYNSEKLNEVQENYPTLSYLASYIEGLDKFVYYEEEDFSESNYKYRCKKTRKMMESILEITGEPNTEIEPESTCDIYSIDRFRELYPLTSLIYRYFEMKVNSKKKSSDNIFKRCRFIHAEYISTFPLADKLNIVKFMSECDIIPNLKSVLLINPLGDWLLNEFCLRYGISSFYKGISHLQYLCKDFDGSLHRCILIMIHLQNCTDKIKEKRYSKKELEYFKSTVKDFNELLVDDFMNKILLVYKNKGIHMIDIILRIYTLLFRLREHLCSQEFDFQRIADSIGEHYTKSIKSYYKDRFYSIISIEEKSLVAGQFTSPSHLITVIDDIKEFLGDLDELKGYFENEFNFMIQEKTQAGFKDYLVRDLKNFYLKPQMNVFSSRSILVASVHFFEQFPDRDSELYDSMTDLFENWLDKLDSNYTKLVFDQCTKDSWTQLAIGNPITSSLDHIYTILNTDIALVESYDKVTSKKHKGALKEKMNVCFLSYLEHLYNMFVQQFPNEMQDSLHDIFIQQSYKQSNTIGSPYSPMDKKLKKARKVSIDQNVTVIKLWAQIDISLKKKALGSTSQIMLLPSMLNKVNNIVFLLEKYPDFRSKKDQSAKKTHTLIKRIDQTFIGIITHAIKEFVLSKVLNTLKKSKKKLTYKIYREMTGMIQYINNQAFSITTYIKNKETQRAIIEKIFRELLSQMRKLNNELDLNGNQICLIEYLLGEYNIALTEHVFNGSELAEQFKVEEEECFADLVRNRIINLEANRNLLNESLIRFGSES
eukprot:TRINITY_DN2061_c0_g1_i4.p1 TRINITY_DN2061_c0_g1~~TRINITY_DN2061_c0_g1_i4.p1  ORF type:complete len:946 (+),score=162.20 TRINITY_DN2061_c0_g1_i4:95-2932(+)